MNHCECCRRQCNDSWNIERTMEEELTLRRWGVFRVLPAGGISWGSASLEAAAPNPVFTGLFDFPNTFIKLQILDLISYLRKVN